MCIFNIQSENEIMCLQIKSLVQQHVRKINIFLCCEKIQKTQLFHVFDVSRH